MHLTHLFLTAEITHMFTQSSLTLVLVLVLTQPQEPEVEIEREAARSKGRREYVCFYVVSVY